MCEVFLTQCLEGCLQDTTNVFDFEVVIGDFYHLEEGSDDGVVGLGAKGRVGLLLRDAVIDVFLHLSVEDECKFAGEESMSVLEERDGVELGGQ